MLFLRSGRNTARTAMWSASWKNDSAKDTREVVLFLNAFTPTGWGLESGLSHKADFRQDSYDAVAQLVSPDLIMRYLRKLYGQAVDTAQFRRVQ